MATKFNFNDMSQAPAAKAANDTMVKAFSPSSQPSPQGDEVDTSTDEQAANTQHLPPLSTNTQHPTPITQHPTPNTPVQAANTHPTPNTPSINTPVEHLAQRRMQMQSEFNGAAVQAINLKTFPEAGNWKLEEVVRMFNLKRTPGTPKLTKGALAEMILLDAVNDLYDKVCGK